MGEDNQHTEDDAPQEPYTRRYNPEPASIPPSATDFDNKLFRDVKLRELPRFLYQHMGYSGVVRMQNYMLRAFPPPSYKKGGKGFNAFLIFYAFLLAPNFYYFYKKTSMRTEIIIEKKYGKEFEELPPIEQSRIRKAVIRGLGEPHFA